MNKTILAVSAVAAMAGAAAIAADPFPPLTRASVLEAPLPSSPQVAIVKGARVGFAPGQPTGLHLHPVPVVGIVTAGSFVFQPSGQPARVIMQGEAFYEPANVPILHFDNASTTERAEIAAFYLADRPDRPLIEMLPASGK